VVGHASTEVETKGGLAFPSSFIDYQPVGRNSYWRKGWAFHCYHEPRLVVHRVDEKWWVYGAPERDFGRDLGPFKPHLSARCQTFPIPPATTFGQSSRDISQDRTPEKTPPPRSILSFDLDDSHLLLPQCI
jgi:hypothetical protein